MEKKLHSPKRNNYWTFACN